MGNETTEEFRRGFEAGRNTAEAVLAARQARKPNPAEALGLCAGMNEIAKIETPTEFV